MFPEVTASSQPTVVWLADISDDATIKKIDGAIMGNENVGIGLKRFNCFRLSVLDIADADLRDKYSREAPAFYFFDPAGGFVKKVTGKRAESLSSFQKLMEYTWDKSFTTRMKQFQKDMKNILDGLDKIDIKRQALDRDKAKLEERPNPGLARQVKAAEDEMDEMKKAIEEEEKTIFDACTLRPEFLPKEAAAEER